VSASFYEPAAADATIASVDRDVYSSRYQKEKDACIQRLLAHVPLQGTEVLEIGCGAGVWTQRLARAGASVTALDVLPHLVEAATARIKSNSLDDRCRFLCGNLDDVVPENASFDFVFFKDVIEHVHDDREVVAQIARRLAPGGLLFVSTQNALCLNFALESFWERIIKRHRGWMGWDETHVRFYTPRRLENLLMEHGLSVRHRNAAYFVPYRWFTFRVGRPGWEPGWCHVADRHSDDCWLARFGWSIHVLASKTSSPARPL